MYPTSGLSVGLESRVAGLNHYAMIVLALAVVFNFFYLDIV